MQTKVIFPGTFDPITHGHLDIIKRASLLFSDVVVAVAANPTKKPLFSLKQRAELIHEACAELSNVTVISFSGLLADLVISENANVIIRGVRGVNDFEYEVQLAHLNRMLTKGVESIFFPPSEKWSYVSSTMVREIYLHGGDVSHIVPPIVLDALNTLNNSQ